MRRRSSTATTAREDRSADVGEELFRRALGAHAAGVVVVTAALDGSPAGMTATSFTSVSLAPPLVSFYIDGRSGTWPAIREADAFAVNILGEEQHNVASRFAAKGVDRFASPTRWHTGPEGLPLIDGAAVHVLCRKHDLIGVGDHWLVVGRVAGAEVGGGLPLLYHRGRYGRFEG